MTSLDYEKRLKRLESVEEIKQLQAHYINCLLTTDWDSLAGCFTQDAIVDINAGRVQGRGEIFNLFKENISRVHIGQEGPFVVHPIISVDGELAKGNWLLYLQFARPRKLEGFELMFTTADAPDWMQGFYEVDYRRVNDQWKISSLRWRTRLASPTTSVKAEFIRE